MQEREALLTLCLIPSIGPATVLMLKEQYGSFRDALTHRPADWKVGKHIKASAQTFLQGFTLTEFLSRLKKLEQAYIMWDDEAYPDTLRNIATPPPILFYQGNLSLLKTPCIAVVGTRNPSQYAEKVVNYIVPTLAYQHTIVSGFQRGVDQLAHQAAIDTTGNTIAVLGTGINIPYPTNSRAIRQQLLAKGGLFISEFPPDTHAEKGNFPRRNRIASGLAHSVIIVEAALQSGSLVTAKHAVEQGKEVYAVPGSIFSRFSEGTNYLLKQGAKVLTTAQDILGGESKTLSYLDSSLQASESLIGWKKELYAYIFHATPTLDDCLDKFQRPTSDILSALTEMELLGMIQKQDSGIYEIA